jgi:hypothetical protein
MADTPLPQNCSPTAASPSKWSQRCAIGSRPRTELPTYLTCWRCTRATRRSCDRNRRSGGRSGCCGRQNAHSGGARRPLTGLQRRGPASGSARAAAEASYQARAAGERCRIGAADGRPRRHKPRPDDVARLRLNHVAGCACVDVRRSHHLDALAGLANPWPGGYRRALPLTHPPRRSSRTDQLSRTTSRAFLSVRNPV